MKTAHRNSALEALRVNLVVERARALLSQDMLAHRAGVSRPTLSRIERGTAADVGVAVVQRIADALGVTVAHLFEPSLEPRHETDEEVAHRIATGRAEDFTDADALFVAMDDLHRITPRYSRRGRPPVARPVPSENGEAAPRVRSDGSAIPADTPVAENGA